MKKIAKVNLYLTLDEVEEDCEEEVEEDCEEEEYVDDCEDGPVSGAAPYPTGAAFDTLPTGSLSGLKATDSSLPASACSAPAPVGTPGVALDRLDSSIQTPLLSSAATTVASLAAFSLFFLL